MKLIPIIVLLLLTGCYTDKKATNDVTKAILKKPAIAADLTRKAFPCITTNVDTFITSLDTTILVDCPDTSSTQYFTLHDTTFIKGKEIIKTIKVPVKVTLPAKEIVKYVKDSADIIVINTKLNIADKKIEELEGKVKNKNKYILWLIILSVILGGTNYLQWKMRKSR